MPHRPGRGVFGVLVRLRQVGGTPILKRKVGLAGCAVIARLFDQCPAAFHERHSVGFQFRDGLAVDVLCREEVLL